MDNIIRIGTRESRLALWQAKRVKEFLGDNLNCPSELIFIKSDGDINTAVPLYELGVQGVFTKALDIALLDKRIDIAVHSYKDVPVQLAEGLTIAAVLQRGNPFDTLVCRDENAWIEVKEGRIKTIATGSIRRKAQWLYRYPQSIIESIRGNVNSRLQKLQQSDWQGSIFAAAGLERLELINSNMPVHSLSWMLPAPAQGAIVLVCRKDDKNSLEICSPLNDVDTAICTLVERKFMRLMMGGCSTPISAYATIENAMINFHGNITATDGTASVDVKITDSLLNVSTIADRAAATMKEKGIEKYYSTY